MPSADVLYVRRQRGFFGPLYISPSLYVFPLTFRMVSKWLGNCKPKALIVPWWIVIMLTPGRIPRKPDVTRKDRYSSDQGKITTVYDIDGALYVGDK